MVSEGYLENGPNGGAGGARKGMGGLQRDGVGSGGERRVFTNGSAEHSTIVRISPELCEI